MELRRRTYKTENILYTEKIISLYPSKKNYRDFKKSVAVYAKVVFEGMRFVICVQINIYKVKSFSERD